MTGCYNVRVGIEGALTHRSDFGLSAGEMTLAELVKQKGYATACYGKWHLGHHPKFLPTRHGFDEYFGLPYSNDMWPLHPRGRPAVPRPAAVRRRTDRQPAHVGRRPEPAHHTVYRARGAVHREQPPAAVFALPGTHDGPRAAARVRTSSGGAASEGCSATW